MASVLVSCSDAKNEDEGVCGLPTEDTETEALGTEASSEENVETEAAAVGYELSNFVIVYGDVCNMKIATDLRAKFESEYKVTLAMRKATEKNEAELEIIIGDSPRAVSSPCFDPLNTKYLTAYGIVCDNGKVQLLGTFQQRV